MEQWITRIMETLSYWGIALLMFLENLVPPIPSEVIMPMAGFTARQGGLNIWWAIVAGTVGSLAGVVMWYVVADRVGQARLKRWLDRWGKWVGLCGDDVDRATRWFEHWGPAAVLICRLIPGVRTFISIPAGFAHMPLWKFLSLSLIGTVAWTAILAWLGWLLQSQYHKVQAYVEPISIVVLVLLAAGFVWWIVSRWRKGQPCD